MKPVYVWIRLDIEDEAEPADVANEMDVTIQHVDLIDYEVVGYREAPPV